MSFSRLALTLCLLSGAVWLSAEAPDPVRLSSKPGIYRDSVLLSIETDPGITVRYRFRPSETKFISFNQALVLASLPGETRNYRLTLQIFKNDKEIEKRDLDYVIDSTPPFSPEPLIAPFTYFGPTQVSFGLNPRDAAARISCSIRGSDGTSLDLTDGKSFELPGKAGLSIQYAVTVFAEDTAHNASPTRTWNYTIDRRQEREVPALTILSPVEGRFQNPQYLYVDNQAFEHVRYTTDGSDPRNGKEYMAGLLLEMSGRIDLRVWGKTFSGKELEKRISYESSVERLPEIESGTIGNAKILQFNHDVFHYAVGERAAQFQDAVLSAPLRISPQPGALRGLSLNLFRERDQAVFRYYLLLDGRQPNKPELWLRTKNPLGGNKTIMANEAINEYVDIMVQSSPGSRCWYRLDGQALANSDTASMLAPNSLHLDRAELEKSADSSGIVTLSFQSRQNDGLWGPINRVPLQLHTPLSLPSINLAQGSDQQSRITVGDWPGTIWYTVSSEYHDKNNGGPFALPGNTKIDLPFGAQGHFSYQFFGIGPDGMAANGQAKLNLAISLVPPDEPLISRGIDGKIRITGANSIFYRVSSDKAGAPSVTDNFQPYTEAFELKPLADENIVYWVEAQVRDGSGIQSAVAKVGPFPLHTKAPKAVRIVGGEGELFRNQNNFKLQLESPEPGMRYYYSLGLEDKVSDPDRNSPWAENEIPVQRKEETVKLELRVRGISTLDPRLVGPVAKFSLNIDTRLPSAPKIVGVESGKVYGKALNIEISADGDSQISYRLRRSGDTDDKPFIDYTQAIHIDAPAESSTEWELMVKTRNRAGSESALPKPWLFRVTTVSPALPNPVFSTSDGKPVLYDEQKRIVSRDDLVLQIATQPGNTIRYELSQDQNKVRVPDPQSPIFERRLTIRGEPKTNREWYLRYRNFDEAGNQSPLSAVYIIRINHIPPPVPARPQLVRQGNSGDLSWQATTDTTIQYMLSGAEVGHGQIAFQSYNGEHLHWDLSAGQDKLWVYYRAIDNAGNTSETAIMTISQKALVNPPKVSGVTNGGLYPEPIQVRVSGLPAGAQVRYEIGTGDQRPAEVGPQSPAIGDVLEIGPINGETVSYHLALRVFLDGAEASEPINYDFTIDRTPPLAPKIANLPSIAWLSKTSSVHLSADAGDTIYYCLTAENLSDGDAQVPIPPAKMPELIANANFQPLSGDISLPANPVGIVRYLLLAYSLDQVGNRSVNMANWQIFVDTRTVFVSDASEGNPPESQLESGTRVEPFHDLAKAIEFAKKNDKRTLFISSGKFIVNATIQIAADLTIRGGFDAQTWLPKSDESTIIYPRPGFSDSSLFDIKDSKFRLQGIYVIDAGLSMSCLLRQRNGSVTINASNLAVTLTPSAIKAEAGTISLNDCSVSTNDPVVASLLALQSMECHLSNVILENSDLPPVLSKNANRSTTILIDSAESTIDAIQIRLLPRRALYSTAVRMVGGSLTVANSELWTGAGTQSAQAIDASRAAKINLSNCLVRSNLKANTAVLARMESSELFMNGGTLWLEADSGAYGIWANRGTVTLDGCEIKAVQSKDFLTILSLEDCKLQVQNSRISGADTPDLRLAVLRGGESLWKGNSCKISSGQTMPGTGLFSLQSNGKHEFTDNNFSGNDLSTLFYIGSEETKLMIRNNILEHWRFLLQESSQNLVRQSDRDRGVSTIQELEQLDKQGSLFAGNKVRQGL